MSLCVFFFKQKTAYEMRISDWSSDVCSSDLLPRAHDPDRPAAHVESQQAFQRQIALADPRIRAMDLAVERQHQRHAVFGDGMGRTGGHPGHRQAKFVRRLQKNGRASCMERGGKYVEVAVVAGTIKKKK